MEIFATGKDFRKKGTGIMAVERVRDSEKNDPDKCCLYIDQKLLGSSAKLLGL